MNLRFERGRPDNLKTLHPAYFALVMATGIVAIATRIYGVPLLPVTLFWINVFFLACVIAAMGMRLVRYPDAVAEDISSHSRGVGFFTAVAAAGVFGTQLLVHMNAVGLATVFWFLANILWVVITYSVLAALTVKSDKPSLADGLNGGWLLSVVATQSVSVLTALLVSSSDLSENLRQPLMFYALVLWLGGGALYLWVMTLIFLRYTFFRMSPEDLTPPYWINMGAVAISTLAGATLVNLSLLSPVVTELSSFVKGLTLFFWAIGTWWIPMLVVLGIWRYLIRGVPFSYDPLYWGGVFPIGMYSVCTYRLAEIIDTPFLIPLSQAFMIVAVVAWVVTFVGMIDSLVNFRRARLPGERRAE